MPTDPRVERSKQTVLETTRGLLCDKGVRGTSIESIAKKSGVAKTTIYRHWSSLDDILLEAFKNMAGAPKRFDTGSVVKDVTLSLQDLAHCFRKEDWSKAMPDMMEKAARDPKFKARKEQFMSERLKPLNEALQRGIKRSELSKKTDIPFLTSQLLGPIFMDYMAYSEMMGDRKIKLLVERTLSSYMD